MFLLEFSNSRKKTYDNLLTFLLSKFNLNFRYPVPAFPSQKIVLGEIFLAARAHLEHSFSRSFSFLPHLKTCWNFIDIR